MLIDQCSCHKRKFTDVLAIARAHQCEDDFDRVLKLAGCGQNCAACHPFIRCVLETGQTQFDEYPAAYAKSKPDNGS